MKNTFESNLKYIRDTVGNEALKKEMEKTLKQVKKQIERYRSKNMIEAADEVEKELNEYISVFRRLQMKSVD